MLLCASDLLNPEVNGPGGLKIRSQPGIGVYVEKLTPMPVRSYKEIESQMEVGTTHRTVAATDTAFPESVPSTNWASQRRHHTRMATKIVIWLHGASKKLNHETTDIDEPR